MVYAAFLAVENIFQLALGSLKGDSYILFDMSLPLALDSYLEYDEGPTLTLILNRAGALRFGLWAGDAEASH